MMVVVTPPMLRVERPLTRFDWMSVTALANYTSKETNGDLSPNLKILSAVLPLVLITPSNYYL